MRDYLADTQIDTWRFLVNKPWGRFLSGLMVLLVVSGVSYFGLGQHRERLLLLSLLLPLGMIGVYILVRWPPLGLLALVPASLVVRFGVATGTQTQLHAGLLLLGALFAVWLLGVVSSKGKIRLVSSRPLYPLLGLILVAVLAFISGQLPWFAVTPAPLSAQLGGLGMFILSGVAFFLTGQQIRELKWLRWMTWLFLIVASFYVIGWLVGSTPLVRLFPFGATGSIFWLWIGALCYAQALVNRQLHTPLRIALLLLAAGGLYVAYFTLGIWKSAWIPPLIAIMTITALRMPKLGIALIVGTLLAGPTVLSELIASDRYSFETRLEAWQILGQIVKVNPLLGLGPANYYFYTPLYTIRGYYSHFNSHNQYVDLVAQAGVLALFFYLWFSWELGRLAWKLRDRVPSGFAQAYVYGALGGLIGTLVAGMLGDWIIPFVYNVGFHGFRSSIFTWLFLGGLVALEQMVSARNGIEAS